MAIMKVVISGSESVPVHKVFKGLSSTNTVYKLNPNYITTIVSALTLTLSVFS